MHPTKREHRRSTSPDSATTAPTMQPVAKPRTSSREFALDFRVPRWHDSGRLFWFRIRYFGGRSCQRRSGKEMPYVNHGKSETRDDIRSRCNRRCCCRAGFLVPDGMVVPGRVVCGHPEAHSRTAVWIGVRLGKPTPAVPQRENPHTQCKRYWHFSRTSRKRAGSRRWMVLSRARTGLTVRSRSPARAVFVASGIGPDRPLGVP